jgi:hypothetical protein
MTTPNDFNQRLDSNLRKQIGDLFVANCALLARIELLEIELNELKQRSNGHADASNALDTAHRASF